MAEKSSASSYRMRCHAGGVIGRQSAGGSESIGAPARARALGFFSRVGGAGVLLMISGKRCLAHHWKGSHEKDYCAIDGAGMLGGYGWRLERAPSHTFRCTRR